MWSTSFKIILAILGLFRLPLPSSPATHQRLANSKIPKIISFLSAEDLSLRITAMDCILDIAYFGRKVAIEAMLEEGLIDKLVELQRSKLGGDLIDMDRFRENENSGVCSGGVEKESKAKKESKERRFLESHPFASCVARFAVHLDVGEGLRQWERRAFRHIETTTAGGTRKADNLRRWTGELEELSGKVPIQVLRSLKQHWKQKKIPTENDKSLDFASFIRLLGREKMPRVAQQIFVEMKSEGFQPGLATLSALMLCYAENGLFSHAKSIWEEIIASSFVPTLEVVSDLMDAYGKMGHFSEVTRILHEATSRDFDLSPEVYSVAISCFGKGGQLEMMEATMKEMVKRGFRVGSATANAFVRYNAAFASLTEMEIAYGRLKKSRILIEEEAIRAVALAYIKERKFYNLGEFLRDVGLGRKNVGNLLWNLLLLSYAGNFKMKTLQREFLRMVEAGFSPDLNTFNIRALAFSRMSLFWDLHVSLEHMKHEKVIPDLVTYGCVVDAYLDRKLGRNLNFALNKMNVDDAPVVSTEPLVFEVFGKGDFHSSSEAFMEYKRHKNWTYRDLITMYLKKEQRRNQVFWNY